MPVYWLEALLSLLLLLQWGPTYPDGPSEGSFTERELRVQRFFPFSTNSVLAGLSLVSIPETLKL